MILKIQNKVIVIILILLNVRKINYEKYKEKNPRYKNSKNNESINDSKFNRYEKIGNTKYEKNSKFLNENLTGFFLFQLFILEKEKLNKIKII